MSRILLGRGGFGDVEKIQHNGIFFARKTLIIDRKNLHFSEELKRRFKREVGYQAKFNHKNIVSIIWCQLESEPLYFDMPLATCQLGKEISCGVDFTMATRINSFLDSLDGIEVIHNAGHVHRDIKPANILRFDNFNGYWYAISDFGLISPSDRENTTNITSTGAGFGTEIYMAPECFLSGSSMATVSSDIYSLGVVLLFLFGNPSEGLGFPYTERESDSVWKSLIAWCTKREPKERPQFIDELRMEFNDVLAKLGKSGRHDV